MCKRLIPAVADKKLRAMLVSECEKMHKQGRIKEDTTGAIASARRCKGIPRDEIYLFQRIYSFEIFSGI